MKLPLGEEMHRVQFLKHGQIQPILGFSRLQLSNLGFVEVTVDLLELRRREGDIFRDIGHILGFFLCNRALSHRLRGGCFVLDSLWVIGTRICLVFLRLRRGLWFGRSRAFNERAEAGRFGACVGLRTYGVGKRVALVVLLS